MQVQVQDWGQVEYLAAWERQLAVHEQVRQGADHTLVLVEHPPVLTLGASFHDENLLLGLDAYRAHGIDVHTTDRGGDVTYHGPGQLVIYPIFDVSRLGRDLHRFLRDLEEAILVLLASFGLDGRRFPPHTGVWIEDRKVAAIGIKVRKWVSLHGIALNCDNDLAPFDLFVPCGIQGYGVTSLTNELGRRVGVEEAKPAAIEAFRTVFEVGR